MTQNRATAAEHILRVFVGMLFLTAALGGFVGLLWLLEQYTVAVTAVLKGAVVFAAAYVYGKFIIGLYRRRFK